MQTLVIRKPDDFHLHVRDGNILAAVIPHTARQFQRAVIMPNLQPPVTTAEQALAYRQRIQANLPRAYRQFDPMMALYLTESTASHEIDLVADNPHLIGFKLYPAGATTHSDAGISRVENIYPLLEKMQERNVPLLVHGEVTDPEVDIFDREKVFIDRHLSPITQHFPGLRIVLEHVTTADAVQFVSAGDPKRLAATITPQHLVFNRNAIFQGGIRPHHYCLPVLKRESHRQALLKAATSGDRRFFLGTDSAPHSRQNKEAACGCAGCYSASCALEWYASIFEQQDALDKLEGFASQFGAEFYGLPLNSDTVTLEKVEWIIPENYPVADNQQLVPLGAGQQMSWKQKES